MKKRGRRSQFTEDITKQLLQFLGGGISIRNTCQALGISERSFYAHCERDAAFHAEIQRARAMGKIRLIREVVTDRDWRAKSWYLSVCYPSEFGRVEDRRLPDSEAASAAAANKMPPLTLVFSTPDGKTKPVTFAQAEKILCGGFPIRDELPDESGLGNDAG
jgi:hypothetical protein